MSISILALLLTKVWSDSVEEDGFGLDLKDLDLALSEENQSEEYQAFADFVDLVKFYGYGVETHNVTTADGYILTIYRILGNGPKKSVVFLMHGLTDMADGWITNNASVAIKLVDEGYDVWCGNSRGTYHSRTHQTLDPNKAEYWAFTWQHMADYDIPASINYVLSATKQAKLSYIGHSQGTIQMFAHLADHPEFISKLHIFIALAPVGTMINIDIPYIKYIKLFQISPTILCGKLECLPFNEKYSREMYKIAKDHSLLFTMLISSMVDKMPEVDNTERYPVIFAHTSGGTSTLNMKHWAQMIFYKNSKVQRFDYGSDKENIKAYGQASPPEFDFSKIPGPIALFHGGNDRLASPTDFIWLNSVLRKTSVVEDHFYPDFGHGTFLWAKDLSYIDNHVIPLIEKYSNIKTKSEL